VKIIPSLPRGLAAAVAGGVLTWLVFQGAGGFLPGYAAAILAMAAGAAVVIPIILPELRVLLHL
jgi:hypothetical protein